MHGLNAMRQESAAKKEKKKLSVYVYIYTLSDPAVTLNSVRLSEQV